MNQSLRVIGKLLMAVLLVGVLFSFAMFQGGFVSWFLFFAVLPVFLYQFGVLLYPIREWRLSRHVSRHKTRAGERVHVTLTIRRSVPFPVYYCLCDEQFPDTLQQVDNVTERGRRLADPSVRYRQRQMKQVLFPGFRRVMKLSYSLADLPRGEHTLPGVRIRTSDMFGMITKEHYFSVTDTLEVSPAIQPVQLIGVDNHAEQGSSRSQKASLTHSNAAAGLREYVPGDSLSWIDWKQTARRNQIITKEFEQENSSDTLVALDASAVAARNPQAFETAIELTLGLLQTVRQKTTEVELLAAGSRTMYFPLSRTAGQHAVRRHLTHLQPGGAELFSVVLRRHVQKSPPIAHLFLVLTGLEADLPEVIRQLGKRHVQRMTILLIQASGWATQREKDIMHQLRAEGIIVNVLSETELSRERIKVRAI